MVNYKIGEYKVSISFDLDSELLDEDILCNENGDWILDETGDWIICDGKTAFKQDLQTSYDLKLLEDLFDPEQGNELHLFKNANFTEEKTIELKHKITEWLEKDDRIKIDTLEVTIERQ